MPEEPSYPPGLQDWQTRIIDEKRELDERMTKLDAFIQSEPFQSLPQRDQYLLQEQYEAMDRYSDILKQRIARFPAQQV